MVTIKYFPDVTLNEHETRDFDSVADFLRWVNLPCEEMACLRFFHGDVLGSEIDTSDGTFIHFRTGDITVINNKTIPQGPVEWVYVAVIFVSAFVAVKLLTPDVTMPTVAEVGVNRKQGSATNKLGGANNELVSPGDRIDDIFGKVTKHTPKLWQTPYRIGVNNQETEIQLLCVGRGKYNINNQEIYDNTTRFLNIPGTAVNLFSPGTWPGNGTPYQTIGQTITRPIGIYRESASLNSTELLPPNDLAFGESAVWTISGNGTEGTFNLINSVSLGVFLNDYFAVGQTLTVLDTVVTSPETVSLYRLDVNVSSFGLTAPGGRNWFGGVLANNGKIYGVPSDSTQVLEIDPVSKTTSLFGSLPSGNIKWDGGALAPNGKIYCAPHYSTQILEIDPVNRTTSLFGDVSHGSYTRIYSGVVTAPNGKLYFIPRYGNSQILELDPVTRVITFFSTVLGTVFEGGWSGGALAPNGKIYCAPLYSTQVLEIDPVNGTTSLFGSIPKVDNAYRGAVYSSLTGKVYCVPASANEVLEVDIVDKSLSFFTTGFNNTATKWWDGTVGSDGKIYCAPYFDDKVLEIDPVKRTSRSLGQTLSTDKFWSGAVTANDGSTYFIPTGGSAQTMQISPGTNRTYRNFSVDNDISGDYEVIAVNANTVTVTGFNYSLNNVSPINNSFVVRRADTSQQMFLTTDNQINIYDWYLSSDEIALSVDDDSTHQSDIGQQFNNVVGPFVIDEGSTSVLINLTSFSGFYKLKGSSYLDVISNVRIVVEEINGDEVPTGESVTTTVTYRSNPDNRTSSVYQTYEVDVPYAHARVYASRLGDRDKSEDVSNVDKMEWSLLYTYRPNPPETDLGDVTLMHVLVPSNSQSRLVKARKTNLTVTRKITPYLGNGVFGDTESLATPDFSQILVHTALDMHCGRLTLDDINADSILSLRDQIIEYSGDPTMTEFGYVFDTSQMSYDDMFSIVCNVVNCIPYMRDGKYDAFFEGEQTESTMQITHRNKVPGSESRTDDFTRIYDSVQLTYRDNDEGISKTIYVPADMSGNSPETKELLGCVNEIQARQHANRMYNKQLYQRSVVEFDTDEFGRMITPGQRIDSPDGTRFNKFSNTSDGYKVYDGEVVEVNGLEVELSQPVTFTDGENHYIRFTNLKGESSELIQCYATDDEFVITLAVIPTEPIYDGYERDRTKFVFCSEQLRTSIALIAQTIDVKVDGEGKETVSIVCKNYDDRIYKDDVRSA